MTKQFKLFILLLATVLIASCSTVKEVPGVKKAGFTQSDVSADSILAEVPNYGSELSTVKGKGKAIVSEPKGSERVTLYFSGNREKSLITIKNSIGIEGGQMLTDGDTLLIYNKVDKYARKIALEGAQLSDINNLASINLLEMLNASVQSENVNRILENDKLYLLQLNAGGEVYVSKKSNLIQQINQPESSAVPYSQIKYDGYSTIEGLKLPRRITIFSTDKSAKVDLLVQSLQVNPALDKLTIDLPDDIKIYYR